MSEVICIGHRGARGHAPENTLASIRKALELGAACIEIDVYVVEGRLLVFHDDHLDRTTNGSGYLMEQSFNYLRSLDAGGGERIPTLEEVCLEIDAKAGLNIELKGPATGRPVVQFVERLFSSEWSSKLILLSSFDYAELTGVRSMNAEIRLGVLIERPSASSITLAREVGAYSIHPSIKYVKQEFVAEAHAQGLKVYVYTVNELRDLRKMAQLGVDGVFTDYPDRAVELFGPSVVGTGFG